MGLCWEALLDRGKYEFVHIHGLKKRMDTRAMRLIGKVPIARLQSQMYGCTGSQSIRGDGDGKLIIRGSVLFEIRTSTVN